MDVSECTASQDWGSVDDSEVINLLKQRDQKNKANNNDLEIPKQGSVGNGLAERTKSLVMSMSEDDWGSMNDSQFISFVNKLSQEHAKGARIERANNISGIIAKADLKSPKINEGASIWDSFEDNAQYPTVPEPISKLSNPIEGQSLIKMADQDEEEFAAMEHDDQQLEFGDYRTYFHNKQLKQQEQDLEYVEFIKQARDKEYPPIFKDCIINVNGKTNPDIIQLHKMIILHGGVFLHFLGAKGNATHIIAENLTPRKKIEFRNYKVVKPSWILESIQSGKLLPWSDYMLINNDYGQVKLNFKKTEKLGNAEERENDYNDYYHENYDISRTSQVADPPEVLDKLDEITLHMDAKHPNFLNEFFAKSRLHHLSTWKSDLRAEFLNKAVQILKQSRPENPPNVQPTSKTIIHVDFDCFFATVSALYHKPPIDINKYPICVTHGGGGSDMASCNYIARSKGCKNGMWLKDGKKLCPDLICLDYDFDAYEMISNLFYNILLSFKIDSILPVSIDEALIDVTTLSLTRTPIGIMKDIKKQILEATRCSVSCGCGPNVLLAKLCLSKAKPNGIYHVNSTQISNFLKDVELRQLPGIGRQISAKLETELKQTNIKLSSVLAVSKDKLIEIFGSKTGTRIYEYARGIDDTSIDIMSDPNKFTRKSVSIDVNWGIRFDTHIQVETFFKNLAKEMNKRLMKIRMVGSSITLKLAKRHPSAPIKPEKYLGMGHCDFVSKTSKFGTFTREPGLISSELKYLSRLLNVEANELRGISISITKLISDDDKDFVKNVDSNQMTLPFGKLDKSKVHLIKPDVDKVSGEKFNVSPRKQEVVKDEKVPLILQQLKERVSPLKKPDTKIYEVPESQIDWEIFDELPSDIQEELRRELHRREYSRRSESPKKRKWGKNDISNLLSPTKKKQNLEINEPPVLISKDLIKSKTGLSFQQIGLNEFGLLKEKLIHWFEYTITDKEGADEMDLSLFNGFMLDLLESGDSLEFQQIVQMFEIKLYNYKDEEGYLSWVNVVNWLKDILGNVDYKELDFKF